jgi:hypothetical protein
MKINEIISEGKTGPGLWANIHAKQERIKHGSGEKMRKPGSKGAPTAKNFKDAASEGVAEAQLTPMYQDNPEHLEYLKKQSEISRRTGLAVGDTVTLKDRPGFKGKIVKDWGGGDFTISGSGGGMSQSNNHRANARLIQKIQDEAEVQLEETYDNDDEFFEAYGVMEYNDEMINEAEYQGHKVTLNKPMQGDVKKFKVYTKNEKGNVVKVNFGDPNSTIKKNNPARRRSFRARHNCDNPGPKTGARYWSCRKW